MKYHKCRKFFYI